jgi:hypothetical protein
MKPFLKLFKTTAVLVLMLGLALTVFMPVPVQAAAFMQKVESRFLCVAGEALTEGDVLTMKTDGKCYKADADDSTLRPAIGVAEMTVASAANVGVVTAGKIGGLSSLTKGAAVFLSATAAGTTQTEPAAYGQVLGKAISATEYVVAIANQLPTNAKTKVVVYQVENLAANADIGDGAAANARSLFAAPAAVTLTKISVVGQAAPAGVDDSNTAVLTVHHNAAATAIVTKTYNTGTVFPAANTKTSLGTLDTTEKILAADDTVRLSVVNGTNADLPAFLVLIEYTTAE